jgi:HEAT repeat protein
LSRDSLQEELAGLAEQLESSHPEVVRKGLKRTASIASKQPELVHYLEEMLPALVKLLSHPDPAVCSVSCWAVGHVGRRRPDWVNAVVPQLAHLTQHTSSKVREMTIWAIGVIGRAEPGIVAPYLSAILEGVKDAEGKVRLSAIWACENIATQRPEWFADYLPLFIGMLDDPDTKHVRGEVPELLRVIGKRRPDLVECAVPELRRKLNDSDRVTRVHAAGALKAIRKAKGISK